MTFSPDKIIRKPEMRAPIMILYAPNGHGKTTFLASIPELFIIDTEDKCNEVNTPRYVPESYTDVIESLLYILNGFKPNELPYNAIAIDTLDWLEKRTHEDICLKYNVKTIIDDKCKELNFGKGNILAANMFIGDILPLIEAIRKKHNIPIILCAQHQKIKVKEPDKDEYSVIDLRLDSKLAGALSDKVEAKLYLNCRYMKDQKGSMIPSDERFLITSPQKGIAAKNSLDLPNQIIIGRYTGWQDFYKSIGLNKPPKIQPTIQS